MFQFTHPGKGATMYDQLSYEEYKDVSIHAPWEGCDSPHSIDLSLFEVFQFTHPGKGATGHKGRGCKPVQFQFTHPGKGATNVKSL